MVNYEREQFTLNMCELNFELVHVTSPSVNLHNILEFVGQWYMKMVIHAAM